MHVGHVLRSKGAEAARVLADDELQTAARLLAAERLDLRSSLMRPADFSG